jgi:hypothetical protein
MRTKQFAGRKRGATKNRRFLSGFGFCQKISLQEFASIWRQQFRAIIP